jgi:hypothetical protein
MQIEERNIGAVEWETYGKYLKFGGGVRWGLLIVILLLFAQAAQGRRSLAVNSAPFLLYSAQSVTTYS